MCHRDFYQICLGCTFKEKKTVLNGFIRIANESKRKPTKLGADQGKIFYNRFMQKRLDDNDILTYSTHNEGKSVVGGRFIRSLSLMIANPILII